ncbi:MAG: serine/threonine protein kinase [Deltaproteobacteria bacterium]|nr:serine/threonine protein kinase [Deltaproteobacteria bacterium]
MSASLPRQVDHYRLEEKLGAGGMGVVYRAIDTLLDRAVAIKMMHAPSEVDPAVLAEAQARFLREAKAAARIRSRYVAHVLQLSTTATGEAYIVMEFLQGETLSRALARVGRLPPARAVAIGRQLCRGMQAAHDLGVVHRDLKPANVMLVHDEGEEVAKILDFGVAKLSNEEQTKGLTRAGALIGTLPFMAPEQLTSSPVDARTDVYALGILLYRMLTGVPLWEVESLADIVRHQISSPPPSMLTRVTNPGFTAAVDAVVLRCLEKSPAQRWQSMRELGEALETAMLDPGVVPVTVVNARIPAEGGTGSGRVESVFDDGGAVTAVTGGGGVWTESAAFASPSTILADAGHDGPTAFPPASPPPRAGGKLALSLPPAASPPLVSLESSVSLTGSVAPPAPARDLRWAAATLVVLLIALVVAGGALVLRPSSEGEAAAPIIVAPSAPSSPSSAATASATTSSNPAPSLDQAPSTPASTVVPSTAALSSLASTVVPSTAAPSSPASTAAPSSPASTAAPSSPASTAAPSTAAPSTPSPSSPALAAPTHVDDAAPRPPSAAPLSRPLRTPAASKPPPASPSPVASADKKDAFKRVLTR